jgi:hypothetical protein
MSFVGIEDDDDVAVVTLARPPANALDPALVTEALAVRSGCFMIGPPRTSHGVEWVLLRGADLRVVPGLSRDEQADMARDVNRLFSGTSPAT